MFRFSDPLYLYGLLIIPLLILVLVLNSIIRKKMLSRFAVQEAQKNLLVSYSSKKHLSKTVIFFTALVLIIISLAGPQLGSKLEEYKQNGIDIFVVLDVSLSMKAIDVKPDRLENAKYQISSLINKLKGDRIGIVIFAGEAFMQCPLTSDYSAANLFLSDINERSIPLAGTNIADAINIAAEGFDSLNTAKAIIVISDGEDHQGNITDAVKHAVDKNIKVYSVGVGSPDGANIVFFEDNTPVIKTDYKGDTVITKLNEDILKSIAAEGKGTYYRSESYDNHLEKIFNELSKLQKNEIGTRIISDYQNIYYYFLIPGLLLLIAEIFISYRRNKYLTDLSRKLGISNETI